LPRAFSPRLARIGQADCGPTSKRLAPQLSTGTIEHLEGFCAAVANPQRKPWIAKIENLSLSRFGRFETLDAGFGEVQLRHFVPSVVTRGNKR